MGSHGEKWEPQTANWVKLPATLLASLLGPAKWAHSPVLQASRGHGQNVGNPKKLGAAATGDVAPFSPEAEGGLLRAHLPKAQ